MELGIATTDFPAQTPESLFGKLKAFGFSQAQLNFSSIGLEEIPGAISPDLVEKIKVAANRMNIDIVAVNGTFNMISTESGTPAKEIKRFASLAAACRKLDCRIITLCTGTRNPLSMWKWHPENSSDTAWREMHAHMEVLIDVAENEHITLGVEVEPSNVVSSPELARRLLDEIHSPFLKIVMDCANLFPRNTAYPANVRKVIKHAFSLLGGDIVLAHGKDILASADIIFASPGKGIIDYDFFLEMLEKYEYRGGMILHGIQQESDIPGCVDFMKERIRQHHM